MRGLLLVPTSLSAPVDDPVVANVGVSLALGVPLLEVDAPIRLPLMLMLTFTTIPLDAPKVCGAPPNVGIGTMDNSPDVPVLDPITLRAGLARPILRLTVGEITGGCRETSDLELRLSERASSLVPPVPACECELCDESRTIDPFEAPRCLEYDVEVCRMTLRMVSSSFSRPNCWKLCEYWRTVYGEAKTYERRRYYEFLKQDHQKQMT